jgi:hypothetical protein
MSNSTSRVPPEGEARGLLTRRQVADRLGKSVPTVRRMELTGELNPVVIGGVHLFDPTEIDALKPPGPVRTADATRPTSPGEIAAACFELFEKGKNVTEVCCLLKLTPDKVRALHREWRAGDAEPAAANFPELDDREQEALEKKWRDEMDRTYSTWEKDLEARWHPKRR